MRFAMTLLHGTVRKRLLMGAVLALLSAPLYAGSVAYSYDSLGRLTQATYSNGVVITYVYDAAGNRTSYTVSGAPI